MTVRRLAVDGRLGARARVRPWAFDDGVVHLSLADQTIVPAVDEVRGWVDALAERDVRAIRTGALFPDAAGRFAAAGFGVIDTLALLRADLADPLVPGRHERPRTVGLPSRRLAEASRIDRAAFGDPWGNQPGDLAEIRRATPAHRARARLDPAGRGWPRPIVAFAISGAASGQGYLQRLAVAPDQQRLGHGRALVVDALGWMRSRRLDQVLVNTAVGNEPALALYHSLGFRRLPEQLAVMQLDVPATGA